MQVKVKVKNMTSKNGHAVPNQFIITTDIGQYFQSYDVIVLFWPNHNRPAGMAVGSHRTQAFYKMSGNRSLRECGLSETPKIYLDENYWNYSNTTGRYRNQFLNETIRETQAKIKSGEYMLVNLNK